MSQETISDLQLPFVDRLRLESPGNLKLVAPLQPNTLWKSDILLLVSL